MKYIIVGLLLAAGALAYIMLNLNSTKVECIHLHNGPDFMLEHCGPQVKCETQSELGGTTKKCVFERQ